MTHHSWKLLWTSDRPVAENSTWQHTTLSTHRYPLPPAGFKPAIPTCDQPQTLAPGRSATAIGESLCVIEFILNLGYKCRKITFTPWPLYSRGKGLSFKLYICLGRLEIRSRRSGEDNISCHYRKSNPDSSVAYLRPRLRHPFHHEQR